MRPGNEQITQDDSLWAMVGKAAKSRWKVEYEDTFYKVYDWDAKLAGYFFPDYASAGGDQKDSDAEERDQLVERLNKDKAEVRNGTLLVPMLKLELLDSEGAISIGDVVSSLESCTKRASKWDEWLHCNASDLSIYGTGVHTAREDRNMLSIAIAVQGKIILGEKNIMEFLSPLLDRLHFGGLL